ncbi:NAD(P)-dependent dehydrogenase (short-subunit alcohol dehydrogenase family) [Rhizobium binae]|uniref:NAD(P)-dependent dehydrogenase (Short-subunit alcohol dehydrogenase family) n=1 Tax=Rhizobium binae TaxID=1138190 RepID=A0ABV2MR85_9HYPH
MSFIEGGIAMRKNAPDVSLDGKVTLVTGASRGIGRACALACAAAGSDIVLGVRDVAASAGLIAELEDRRSDPASTCFDRY